MNKEKQITEMFDQISPTYDKVNTILSFGLDRLWRKKLISQLPKQSNLSLLDIATGTGEVLLEAFKQNRIEMGAGVDLSSKLLDIAQQKLNQTPYRPQATFILGNALTLPFGKESFDATTIAYGIRNVQNVAKALSEMHRVLKPGGKALILEFSLPKNKLLKKLHLFYLRKIVPRVGHFFSKNQSAYVYLNETIESFPYGEPFLRHLEQAKFSNCKAIPILGGITTLYVGVK